MRVIDVRGELGGFDQRGVHGSLAGLPSHFRRVTGCRYNRAAILERGNDGDRRLLGQRQSLTRGGCCWRSSTSGCRTRATCCSSPSRSTSPRRCSRSTRAGACRCSRTATTCVRVARDPVLPRPQVPAAADLRSHAGGSRRHHARHLRVPGLHRAARSSPSARRVLGKRDLGGDEVTEAMHAVASEARTIEGRLSKSDWMVGELLGGRHGDLSGHPAAAARAREAAARRSWPRASCRWRSTTPRSVAGSSASRPSRLRSHLPAALAHELTSDGDGWPHGKLSRADRLIPFALSRAPLSGVCHD